MNRLFFCFLWISTLMFSQENPLQYIDFFSVEDIDFSVFENPKYKTVYEKAGNKHQFLNQYFKVWNDKNQPISDADYQHFFSYDNMTKTSPCIGENYSELHATIIQEIKANTSIDKNAIGTHTALGITVNTTDIRILPTDAFCFKHVRNAGEGYPFDYFQESTLWIATPVSILATSRDGLWYFINSHNNKGWVKASSIALVSSEQAAKMQKMPFYTPVNDRVLIKGKSGTTKVFLGSIFPAISNTETVSILIPKKRLNNAVAFEEVAVSNKSFQPFPIRFNQQNVQHILSELQHHKYTWGGLNEGRDCSSTIKDFLTPFGVWLPRNSGQQKQHGIAQALEGTDEEKRQTIVKMGIPFLSGIYKRGHIVLYAGTSKNGIPLIFHNVWGIKAYYRNKKLAQFANTRQQFGLFGMHTKKKNVIETRFNIGKAVLTNIEPSKQLDANFNKLTTERYLENFKVLTLFIQE